MPILSFQTSKSLDYISHSEKIVHDEGKYKIGSDGTLEIIGVSRIDAGAYTCIADNGVGSSAVKQIQLEVKGTVSSFCTSPQMSAWISTMTNPC